MAHAKLNGIYAMRANTTNMSVDNVVNGDIVTPPEAEWSTTW